jgi:hypothetical protein
MAGRGRYPDVSDPRFVERLLRLAEMKRYIFDPQRVGQPAGPPAFAPAAIGVDTAVSSRLALTAHQRFPETFIAPETPFTRIFLLHDPGTGKTLAALRAASEYVRAGKIVAIIGFSRRVFRHELLSWPEFGFVTTAEIARIRRLAELAVRGVSADRDRARDYLSTLQRRLSKPLPGGGRYIFVGYREFANRILTTTGTGATRKVSPSESAERYLAPLKNSLIICDEIHQVYNSLETNDYGLAVRYALRVTGARGLFLTATPLNNSPSEIIDVCRLVAQTDEEGDAVAAELANAGIANGMSPSVVEIIRRAIRGRISYIHDTDSSGYPRRVYEGTHVRDLGALPIILCERTPAMVTAFKVAENNRKTTEGPRGDDATLAFEQYASDSAVPLPDGPRIPTPFVLRTISGDRSRRSGLHVDERTRTVTGEFMVLPTLARYSGKNARFVRDLIGNPIKTFAYHPYIGVTGVAFIGAVLNANGIIPPGVDPGPNTRCAVCGATMNAHHARHVFVPARAAVVHGDMDRSAIDATLGMFNDRMNARGERLLVLIGSRIIRQSYNLKTVRRVAVLGRPDNISTLRQIIGRAIRRFSHAELPEAERVVNIAIYITRDTPEMARYATKYHDYRLIQKLEQILHDEAIDTCREDGTRVPAAAQRGDPFEPLSYRAHNCSNIEDLDRETFAVVGFPQEFMDVVNVVKRAFVAEPVWRAEDLIRYVHSTPSQQFDVRTLSATTIRASLAFLSWRPNTFDSVMPDNLAESLTGLYRMIRFSPGGDTYRVMACEFGGKTFYTLAPMHDTIFVDAPYRIGQPMQTRTSIDVRAYLREVTPKIFQERFKTFRRRYVDLPIQKMSGAVCEYNAHFHRTAAETAIVEYIRNIHVRSPDSFTVKLLTYYIMNVLVFTADMLPQPQRQEYAKVYPWIDWRSRAPALEKISIEACDWCPASMVRAAYLIHSRRDRVPAWSIPVGHTFSELPLMWSPAKSQWVTASFMLERRRPERENSVIIGIDEKPENGIVSRFKLRTPNVRTRGVICATQPRQRIVDYATALGVHAERDTPVSQLCHAIRAALIYNEISERASTKATRQRWFYYHWESSDVN